MDSFGRFAVALLSDRGTIALLLLPVLALLAGSPAGAQEVGSVILVEGDAEIGRNGVWFAAGVGAVVETGDELRTGTPGRMRIIFRDDSLLDVGAASHVVVDEQIFEPASGSVRTLVRLLEGKVRALVSEYYRERNALYEVETPTAVTGVRGTEFVIVYDPVADTTEVIGVSGRVQVNSVLDRVGRRVFVGAREATAVQRGAFPSPPQRMDESRFRQYLEGVTLNRVPRPQTIAAVEQTVLSGAAVPASERAVPAAPVDTAKAPASDAAEGGTESADSGAAPQPVAVHGSELQPTSPQGTGSTLGTLDTGRQTTTVQTTTAQTGRDEPGAARPAQRETEAGTGSQPGETQVESQPLPAQPDAGQPGETQPVGTQPGAAELADVADGTGQTTREQVGTQEVASTEGEAESEEAAADEEKSEEESAAADEGATQVADASGVESESSGSPPADASVGGAAPATLAPVPFLIGPGASATLPEPLNASSLVGAGPVTESRGRLRIRIF